MHEDVTKATSVVFIAYNGLTVEAVNELRGTLVAANGGMRVMPKRLLRLVMTGTKLDFNPLEHEGQIAVVWGDDPVAPAKTLAEFAKKHEEQVRLLAGVLEGNILSFQEVTSLANLPSREQLLAQLVGVMSGPARGFVTVLSEVQTSFVRALKAVADSKGT